MARVLNFLCVALLGFSILGLYQVSERTRAVGMSLRDVESQVAEEQAKTGDLQVVYEHLARPDRIQTLAEASLGMSDTATVQLASLSLLPRRQDAQQDGMLVRAAVQPGM